MRRRDLEVGKVELGAYVPVKDDTCLRKVYTSLLNSFPSLKNRASWASGYLGSTYNHLSDAGSWGSEWPVSVFRVLLWPGRFEWRSGLNLP